MPLVCMMLALCLACADEWARWMKKGKGRKREREREGERERERERERRKCVYISANLIAHRDTV
jgi:hypothetical protein